MRQHINGRLPGLVSRAAGRCGLLNCSAGGPNASNSRVIRTWISANLDTDKSRNRRAVPVRRFAWLGTTVRSGRGPLTQTGIRNFPARCNGNHQSGSGVPTRGEERIKRGAGGSF